MEDQEKLSLRKQVEILNLQKDVLSRQLSKLRDDIAAEKTEFQKTQNKLLDDIRIKGIEIRAVRNYMEKHSSEIKNQLKDEFQALEMEKERIAEVTKELDAKRNMLDNVVTAKQAEFEKQFQTEKELFDKSREDYLKNTKKLQAELDEHIHKNATMTKQLEEEIKSLREELLLKDRALAESRKAAATLLTADEGKDGQIEELKKEISSLGKQKESLADELSVKNIKTKELKTLQANLEKQQKTIEALAADKNEKAARIKEFKKEMELLTAEKDNKDTRIKELTKEMGLLDANKANLSRALDEKNNLINAANENAETLKKSAAQIKAAMFAREKELAEESRQQKEKTDELNTEIESLKKENKKLAALQKTVELLEKEKNTLRDKIDNLRRRSGDSDKTADALMAAIQKNETLEKLNASLEKKLSEQETTRDKKHTKSTSAKAGAAAKFKCSECGAMVGAHDKKCPSCGESFE